MVMARYQANVFDLLGEALPNTQITVRRDEVGAPSLATIYQDREGTVPLGNPFNVSAAPFAGDGFFWFHAPGGPYRIEAQSGALSRTHRYVGISLSAEQDSPPVGASWRFASATADADPGAGLFRLNNADPASATAIYIDVQDKDGVDQSLWLESFDGGGGAAERGILVLRSVDNAAVLVARVTGSVTVNGSPPGYYGIPITVLSASDAATFIAEAAFGLVFSRSGSDGTDGDGDVTGPAGGVVDNEFVYFDAATGKVIKGSGYLIADASAVRSAQANRVMNTALIASASAAVGLSDGATIALNWNLGVNFSVTLAGNRTLGNPSNGQPGTWRRIQVTQDGTGSRTLAYGGNYRHPGGTAPVLSTAAGAVDTLYIYCRTASIFEVHVGGLAWAA